MTMPGYQAALLRRLLKHCYALAGDYTKAGMPDVAEEWQRRAKALAAVLEED